MDLEVNYPSILSVMPEYYSQIENQSKSIENKNITDEQARQEIIKFTKSFFAQKFKENKVSFAHENLKINYVKVENKWLLNANENKDIIKLNLHSLVYIKWEKHILKRIYRITLPSVIGQVGTAIGFMIMNSFIQSYGTETVAAYGMVNRISGLLNIPPGGIGSAITSIIGQNIGNNNIKRVKETFKKASIIIIIMSILIAFISFTFRYEILSFFINAPKESELMIQANSYMFYTLITLVMLNMFFVYQGLFQGSGNSKYSMAIDMIRLWVIRIPLILFFKYFTKQGATGIWLAMAISNILVTIIAHLIYLKGKWQQGSFCR